MNAEELAHELREYVETHDDNVVLLGCDADGPGWVYYSNPYHDELKCWCPGTELRGREEATDMLIEDLETRGLEVRIGDADRDTPDSIGIGDES